MRAVQEYPVREGGICFGQLWKETKQISWRMESLHGSPEHTPGLRRACCPLLLKSVFNKSWSITEKYQFLSYSKMKLMSVAVAQLSMVDTILSYVVLWVVQLEDMWKHCS